MVKTRLETFHRKIIMQRAFSLSKNHQGCLIMSTINKADNTYLFTETMQQLKMCVLRSSNKFRLYISTRRSVMDKVAVGHSNVWQSVLGNFTFQDEANDTEYTRMGQSRFSTTLLQQPYIESLFIFHHFPQDSLSSLRILGCGVQGMSKVPVQELINVFDDLIWICILLSALIVPIFIRLIINETGLPYNVLCALKVILEQGNPFSTMVGNSKRLRLQVGIFLLMGIVTSNAYKNNNVFNMVVPRRPILYKYFNELKRDNFNIYSRTFNSFLAFKDKPASMEYGSDHIFFDFANFTITSLSEVGSHVLNLIKRIQNSGVLEVNMTITEMGVAGAAVIHPDSTNLFRNFLCKNFNTYPFK